MTLSLALTGFDTSNPIPGIYAEVRFAQGETAGDLSTKRVLIMAPKTSAGSITVDTQVVGPLSDEADFITYAGAGSPAHRMGAAFLQDCKNVEVYLICPTAATGAAGSDIFTYTFSSGTAPTKAGVASVTICGVLCSFAYTTSNTLAEIAAGITLAINNHTELPVSATSALGVVTIATKIHGEEFNTVRYRPEVSAGTNVVVSPTADTQLGLSGAGAAVTADGTISYTNALATILGRKFDYILSFASATYDASGVATPGTAAAVDALLDQVTTQAEPSTGFRQQALFGTCLVPANAVTMAIADNMNRPRGRVFNLEQCPEESYVLAARVGANIVKYEVSDASYNFDGFGSKPGQVLRVQRPFNDSGIPTTTEIKSMLNNGVTALGVAPNGQVYIVRSVTSYSISSGVIHDYRARDSIVVTVGDKFTNDLVAKLSASPWTKITADPAAGAKQPPAEFATPSRVKALCEQLVSDYVDAGLFDPAKKQTILDAMQVGIDPVLASRMNIRIPAYSAVLLHQIGLLVNESSPAL
jgi:phage tail sheath gpL-like